MEQVGKIKSSGSRGGTALSSSSIKVQQAYRAKQLKVKKQSAGELHIRGNRRGSIIAILELGH